MTSLDLFQEHNYLNLETFRRDGTGVQTPVWFTREGDVLYIWTEADSGKAKRIRRDGRVRIASCNARGELLGDWIEAQAKADDSPQALQQVRRLLARKYGLVFRGFDWLGRMRRKHHTALHIRLREEEA